MDRPITPTPALTVECWHDCFMAHLGDITLARDFATADLCRLALADAERALHAGQPPAELFAELVARAIASQVAVTGEVGG